MHDCPNDISVFAAFSQQYPSAVCGYFKPDFLLYLAGALDLQSFFFIEQPTVNNMQMYKHKVLSCPIFKKFYFQFGHLRTHDSSYIQLLFLVH